MHLRLLDRTVLRAVALLLCGLWLAGCATSTRLDKVVREDPGSPVGYVELTSDYGSAMTVLRGGRPLPLDVPLTLQIGDEIETGDSIGAIIRYANGDEVVIAPRTRVRLGSLEVLFGQIFASVRGLFSAEDESVLAAVEGTRFMFAKDRRRGTRVVVLDGVVRCSSKTGLWESVRLGPADALRLARPQYPDSPVPRVTPATRFELGEIERWSSGIREAPREGFCCADGRVFRSLSFECRGSFHLDPAAAERACMAPPPRLEGWCCIGGRLVESDADTCGERGGGFYRDQQSAEQACGRQPVEDIIDIIEMFRIPEILRPRPSPTPQPQPPRYPNNEPVIR